MMNIAVRPEDLLFIDIETVPLFSSEQDVPEVELALWKKKENLLNQRRENDFVTYQNAGIYAEFGKIICICAGSLCRTNEGISLQIQSFSGKDEKTVLQNFVDYLSYFDQELVLCAHNGKEFDFPFICRRLLINRINLPPVLQIAGKKPWEIRHLDTLELWKFGDFKHYTSLDLLSHVFGIESPKNGMDGSLVFQTYYQENNLPKIRDYCENDVVALCKVFLFQTGNLNWIPELIEVERKV